MAAMICCWTSAQPTRKPRPGPIAGRNSESNPLMTTIDQAVQALVQARQSQRSTPAPALPDAASAYAVQDGVARALRWFDDGEQEGSAARHWKSGGPSRDAQVTHAPLP